VWGGLAHPITAEPLLVGTAIPPHRRGLTLGGVTSGISRVHCSLVARGDRALVLDHSTHGSFLNEQRIDGSAELIAGDRLRLGSPGIELLLVRLAEPRR
jgi:hypothetical protein